MTETEDRYTRRAAREAEDAAGRALAERLAGARTEWLAQVPLDDEPELVERLARARRMKPSGARRREVRYIGRLLRGVEHGPINAALDGAEQGASADVSALHAAESWRARIIEEGDPALDAFHAEHPTADRQRLRMLGRQALKERSRGGSPKAARALFKLVRAAIDGGSE